MSNTIVRLARTQTIEISEELLASLASDTGATLSNIHSGPWKVVRKDREAPSATPRRRRRRTNEVGSAAIASAPVLSTSGPPTSAQVVSGGTVSGTISSGGNVEAVELPGFLARLPGGNAAG